MSKKSRLKKSWVRLSGFLDHYGFSQSWTYKKVSRGEIPFRKVDGVLMFSLDEVDEWIASQPPPRRKRDNGRAEQ